MEAVDQKAIWRLASLPATLEDLEVKTVYFFYLYFINTELHIKESRG
jgi:hypothetical protein